MRPGADDVEHAVQWDAEAFRDPARCEQLRDHRVTEMRSVTGERATMHTLCYSLRVHDGLT